MVSSLFGLYQVLKGSSGSFIAKCSPNVYQLIANCVCLLFGDWEPVYSEVLEIFLVQTAVCCERK